MIRYEFKGDGVDAVAQSGGFRSVLEDVALVSAAPRTVYFCSAYEQSPVILCCDIFRGDGLPETGPSRSRFVFVVGGEKLEPAGGALVDSGLLVVP